MLNTKEKLISKTAELIRISGFNGTGLSQILKSVGVPKGSLYHHFPKGKDQLMEAALWKAAQQQANIYKQTLKGKGEALAGLSALIDWFIKTAEESEYQLGCPIAGVCLELSISDTQLQNVCKEIFEFWINSIDNYLKYKNINETREKAERFMVQLEGALLLTKVFKSNQYLNNLKSDLKSII